MRGNEMPGKREIGNLLPGHRSALKKICGLSLFCFFAVLGFLGSVNVTSPEPWICIILSTQIRAGTIIAKNKGLEWAGSSMPEIRWKYAMVPL